MGRKRRRKSRDRTSKVQAEAVNKITQPVHNLPLYNLVSEESIEKIHDVSMQILEEIGIDFYDEESLSILKANGATVNGSNVRMGRELVDHWISFAPSEFHLIARNPNNKVRIGGNSMCFAPVYGPPFVYDRDRGRR